MSLPTSHLKRSVWAEVLIFIALFLVNASVFRTAEAANCSAGYTVTVTLNPTSGPSNTYLTASGCAGTATHPVYLFWDGSLFAQTTSGYDYTFTWSFAVSSTPNPSLGPHVLSVSLQSNPPGNPPSATFTVTPSSTSTSSSSGSTTSSTMITSSTVTSTFTTTSSTVVSTTATSTFTTTATSTYVTTSAGSTITATSVYTTTGTSVFTTVSYSTATNTYTTAVTTGPPPSIIPPLDTGTLYLGTGIILGTLILAFLYYASRSQRRTIEGKLKMAARSPTSAFKGLSGRRSNSKSMKGLSTRPNSSKPHKKLKGEVD